MEERQLLFWTTYFLTYPQMPQHDIKSSHLAPYLERVDLIPQKCTCYLWWGMVKSSFTLSLVPTVQSYSRTDGNLHGWNTKKQNNIWFPWLGHDHRATRLLCDTVSISLKFDKNTLLLNSLCSAPTHYVLTILSGASQSFSTIFGWFLFQGTQ